jgi:uncharacterized metal-binding protein
MEPACHKCNSLSFCARGQQNDSQFCASDEYSEISEKVKDIYTTDPEVQLAIKNASIVEAEGYMQWNRLKDTIEYAKLMKYRKLGVAFCVGLMKEAVKVIEILEQYGFSVNSICCKTGSIGKKEVGVPDENIMISKTKYIIGTITCNPVAQALLLNEAKTDLNCIVGLCVGHDCVFTKFSEAPVTTLIAKDRVTMHSPAAVLYTSYGENYFREDIKKSKIL